VPICHRTSANFSLTKTPKSYAAPTQTFLRASSATLLLLLLLQCLLCCIDRLNPRLSAFSYLRLSVGPITIHQGNRPPSATPAPKRHFLNARESRCVPKPVKPAPCLALASKSFWPKTGSHRSNRGNYFTSLRTVRYWISGQARVPYSAYRLLRFTRGIELPCEEWTGWHMHSGKLWTLGELSNFSVSWTGRSPDTFWSTCPHERRNDLCNICSIGSVGKVDSSQPFFIL
jgi:hypothetical protein